MLYDSVLSLRRQTTSAHGHEMSCERYTRPQRNRGRLASWLLTAESSLRACVAEVLTCRDRRGGQVLAAVRPAGADNTIILCGCVIEELPLRPGCNLPGVLCLAGRRRRAVRLGLADAAQSRVLAAPGRRRASWWPSGGRCASLIPIRPSPREAFRSRSDVSLAVEALHCRVSKDPAGAGHSQCNPPAAGSRTPSLFRVW